MTRTLLALLTTVALAGCGGDGSGGDGSGGDGSGETATVAQACDQAEQVTDSYRDSLGKATGAQEAKEVIDRTIAGLRDVEAPAPVAARVDGLADALAGLLTAVEAGAPAAELQPRAAAVGTSTAALAQACGRTGGAS